MVWDRDNEGIGAEQEWAYKSRPHPAQIVDVNADAGTITCEFIGSHERYRVDIPIVGLAIQGKGLRSSWQRYMPQTGEYVMVAFDPRNQAYAVRLITWQFAQDHGGYKLYADAAADGTANLNLIFRKLKEGELDARSSGGAGYYFTADGHATLEAGPTTLDLDKARSEQIAQAGLFNWKGDGVDVRFGDVKRLMPGGYVEEPVDGAVKEWTVLLAKPTPPLGIPAVTLMHEEAGDVRDEMGVPVTGPAGPMRYRRRLYDAAGQVEVLTVEVDVLGNLKVTQAATAAGSGVELSMGTNPLKVDALSAEINTLTSFDVNATTAATIKATTTAKVEGTAALELASGGLPATHPMVYGDILLATFNAHVHLTAFGPSSPPLPLLIGPGTDMSLTTKVS